MGFKTAQDIIVEGVGDTTEKKQCRFWEVL